MTDSVPNKVRWLAKAAQLTAALGIVIIGWIIFSFAWMMFTNSHEFDAMLKFFRTVMLESPDFAGIVQAGFTSYSTPDSFSWTLRTIVYVLEMSINFIGICALFWAWSLFRSYGRGDIFNETSAKKLERIGWSVVIIAPLSILTELWILKALLVTPAPINIFLSYAMIDIKLLSLIGIDDINVFALVFGLVIALAGRIMYEAARLSEENRSFI